MFQLLFYIFSSFPFPCYRVSFLSISCTIKTHFQSILMYIFTIYPLYSFLPFSSTLSFPPSPSSVSGCNMTFRLRFFPLDSLFCHVLLCFVLNILLYSPFSMVHPTTISLPLPPPLPFFSYLTPVFCSLGVPSFLITFFLPVLSLCSSIFVSWTLPVLTAQPFEKVCFGLFIFLISSGTRRKGHAMTCHCLANSFCHCSQIWLWRQFGTAKKCFQVQLVEQCLTRPWIQSPLLAGLLSRLILVFPQRLYSHC